MAELSIEQKAARYDEALKKAKDMLSYKEVRREDVEYLFPELKKSEDERMREMAIKAVYAPEAQSCIKSWGINPDDVVAWLKKQGQQDMIPLDKVIKFLDEQLVNDKDEVTGEPFINFQNYGAFKETFISFFKRKMLEKQSEQKSTDEVKPKFHEGDWVVDKNGTVQQILSYKDGIYKHTNGYSSKMFEDVWRLWDVTKDAKEGDVLVDGNLPFIFKRTDHLQRSYAYCGISIDCGFRIESEGELGEWTWMQDIKPATKKQRDLLFQKMKEAGYEWDAEKKELKKIEQKHFYELDNSYARVTFPFKAKVKSSGAIVTIHNGQISPDGKEWIEYQSGAEDRYKVYKPNNLELVCEIEQKPAFEKK